MANEYFPTKSELPALLPYLTRRECGEIDKLIWGKTPSFEAWLREVTPVFNWEWPHLVHIRRYLDQLTYGRIKRLMIKVPPRHGKSQMVTIRYPVWRLERDPAMRVIVGAYNQDLADLFARSARRIAQSRMVLKLDRKAQSDWETPEGGGYRAVGVGVGITGRGGNLILMDDPVKSRAEADSLAYRERVWDWYTNDLYTRLEPDAALLLITTSWHTDDLAGRILASDDAANWTVITLPALAEANDPLGRQPGQALCPERFNVAALAEIQQVLGERDFAALYQQRPVIDEGAVFKPAWWLGVNRYDALDESVVNRSVGRWISVDSSFTETVSADYSAFGVYELQPEYTLVKRHGERDRLDFPSLLQRIEQLARRYNRDDKLKGVVIEEKGSGISALQTLRAAAPDWLRELLYGFTPVGGKEQRWQQASLWCERGMVLLPEPNKGAEWLLDFEEELFTVPAAAHDDQADEFAQIVIYLEHYLAEGWRRQVRGIMYGDNDAQHA